MIYLDHNASTPIDPAVLDEMLPYLSKHFGNPSSGHAAGRAGRDAVERARERVAAAIGAHPDEIVFTSGGTEASNLAIRGSAEARPEPRRVITSAVEHPATAEPCAWLEAHGDAVTRLGVGEHGLVDTAAAAHALERPARIASFIHAHNETGVVQPIAELAELAHRRGALVHADAAQSVGKIPVHVGELGVDLLTIAGHKLGAPKGVGALYVRRGTPLAPLLRGAGHERGLRPGTENVASIVALGAACERVTADLESAASRMRALRERLWRGLASHIPEMARHGRPGQVLPNTLSVRFPGVAGAALLDRVPAIAASTGSACHAGEHQAPAAIVAMGVSPAEAIGTVRLSVGRTTTAAEIDEAIGLLTRAFHEAPGH